MSSKAFWHSSFHSWGSFFLKSLKMGSQVEVSLAMDRLMYYNRPKTPFISFSLLGGGISNMALIFDGSTSIPLSLSKKTNDYPTVTPNVHFCRFNLSLNFLILLKNFLKLMMWPFLSLDFKIISSAYTLTHCASYHVTRLWPFFSKSHPHSCARMALQCNNKFPILWWR